MKKLFLLCSLFTYLLLPSQERVNRPKLSFEKSSGVITQATGWAYNSTIGEWVDYKNVISNNKDYKGNKGVVENSYMKSIIDQNFIKIQTKSFNYKESTYYVLIINKWKGSFKYPALMDGWEPYKAIYGYIFTKEEFEKLRDINDMIELLTKRYVSINDSYNEVIFLDLIQTELLKEDSNYSPYYKFPVTKSIEGDIRFLIPTSYSGSFIPKGFEKEYFETSIDNFSKLIIQQ